MPLSPLRLGYGTTKRAPSTLHWWLMTFGIKYIDRPDTDHLLNTLKELYRVSVNLSGT